MPSLTSVVSTIIYRFFLLWIKLPALLATIMLQFLLLIHQAEIVQYLKTGEEPSGGVIATLVFGFFNFLTFIGVPEDFSANGVGEVISEPHIRSFLLLLIFVGPLSLWLLDLLVSKISKGTKKVSGNFIHFVGIFLFGQAVLIAPFLFFIGLKHPSYMSPSNAITLPLVVPLLFYFTWIPVIFIEWLMKVFRKKNGTEPNSQQQPM